MKKIGMVVALQKEITPFLKRIGADIKTEKRFGFEIMEFELSGKSIICINSGMGEINAAAATQTLIAVYGVETIINFGVCGALGDISVLETVLVKGVVYYEFDLSPIDPLKVAQYPGEESEVIATDENLRLAVKKSLPGIEEVICASADKFVADEKIKKDLQRRFGAEICEMESAAVLITCKNVGVPCLIVKAISDGKGGAEEFKKMCNEASKAYVDLIVDLVAEL
ncbi:MAG: 5'-methylthioadenosine/S-adenosylhomocysteine nucleosidase [Clostridia bacterium]|nr:5'-methylthioadenosine/S-adenosylhomocysteine nucleosidase [Clostridia bacterium]